MTRNQRQQILFKLASDSFGIVEATNPIQRALRLFEETTEACQSVNCDINQLHKLLDYVYSRPIGNSFQELGGVGVTLLLLADSLNYSADDAELIEIQRIKEITKIDPEKFKLRNDEKNQAGFKSGEIT